eukprot:TRINITY_DN43730_c0_g1_i1.p1 TRINITY_DN43730_c0_g1~~TRINITY_DN43730_c0_g1_i1.p1  ORF type:complete len:587 (+),score=115.39 TRINITY_DN43730_c0_g1_i1:99-1859(+)
MARDAILTPTVPAQHFRPSTPASPGSGSQRETCSRASSRRASETMDVGTAVARSTIVASSGDEAVELASLDRLLRDLLAPLGLASKDDFGIDADRKFVNARKKEDNFGNFQKEICFVRVQDAAPVSAVQSQSPTTVAATPKSPVTPRVRLPQRSTSPTPTTLSAPPAQLKVRIGGGFHLMPTAGMEMPESSPTPSLLSAVQDATSPENEQFDDSFGHGQVPPSRMRPRGDGGGTYQFGSYVKGEARGAHGDRRHATDKRTSHRPPTPHNDGLFRVLTSEPKPEETADLSKKATNIVNSLFRVLGFDDNETFRAPPQIVKAKSTVSGRWKVDFCHIRGNGRAPKVYRRKAKEVVETEKPVVKVVEIPVEKEVEKLVYVDRPVKVHVPQFIDVPLNELARRISELAGKPQEEGVKKLVNGVDKTTQTGRPTEDVGTQASEGISRIQPVRVGGGFDPVVGVRPPPRPSTVEDTSMNAVFKGRGGKGNQPKLSAHLVKVLSRARQVMKDSPRPQSGFKRLTAAEVESESELEDFLQAVKSTKENLQMSRTNVEPTLRTPWPMTDPVGEWRTGAFGGQFGQGQDAHGRGRS